MNINANRRGPRKPGRPPRYTFEEPDEQLTPEERKRKTAILKRRIRQNKAYHRRRANQNKLRANHPANAQVVPEPAFAAHHPLHNPVSPVPTSATHPWPHNTPRVIPDFSQNPLELLASSASGTTNTTQPASFSPSPLVVPTSAVHRSHLFAQSPSVVDTSPSTKSELATSIPEPGSVSAHAVLNRPLQPSSSYPISVSSDQHVPIEIDATANPLDLFPLPFSLDATADHQDSNDPDDLVNSALVAATDLVKAPPSLKDAMDKESDLHRMTGIKTIVFDNLRAKYTTMHPSIQSALRLFVIFPRTFNVEAAISVAGLQQSQFVEMQGMLENMVSTNFIHEVKGRYVLNDPARVFLNEDDTVWKHSLASNVYQIAKKRFVKHYQTQLNNLQNEQIHKIGWLREEAMAWYDHERDNIMYSEFLLEDKRAELRAFLSAGITVMRYCESASEREKVLLKALREDEISTEDILMPFTSDSPTEATSTSEADSERENCDRANRARLQLALSEAYFDQLRTAEAEKPLRQSLQLMQRPTRCLKSKQSSVVELVLVLLLLSNLKLGANETEEARKLCCKALKTLQGATLGRSTFGINAMSNLVTIYLREGQLSSAKQVASTLLNTLNTMRYTGMPIYADALGVCAMVSMAEGEYAEAEKQYLTALETVGKWGSKDWAGVPVEHCLDLDLWLMDGLADTFRKQGRIEEGRALAQRAATERERRGLPRSKSAFEEEEVESGTEKDSGRKPKRRESDKTLRHLY